MGGKVVKIEGVGQKRLCNVVGKNIRDYIQYFLCLFMHIFVKCICLACIVVILFAFVYLICICCILCVFVVSYMYLLHLLCICCTMCVLLFLL